VLFKRYYPPYLEGYEEDPIEFKTLDELKNLFPLKTFLKSDDEKIYYDRRELMVFLKQDDINLPMCFLQASDQEIYCLGLTDGNLTEI
jgi:hypothetical protein